jgi:hypothetical protein
MADSGAPGSESGEPESDSGGLVVDRVSFGLTRGCPIQILEDS